jgi:RNA polymerase sigma-70 factor (ECF subfamily)
MDADRRRQLQAWMVQFADGDRAAFQPLFDGLWPVLLAFTSRALVPAADAEDVAQQVMLKVFSRIADFDRTRDGVSWALGIAAYEVMTLRRRRARRREHTGATLERVDEEGSNLEERAIAGQLSRALRELVGELPERDRDALEFAFAGEPAPTGDTWRKRRLRAVERLRAAWRRAYG